MSRPVHQLHRAMLDASLLSFGFRSVKYCVEKANKIHRALSTSLQYRTAVPPNEFHTVKLMNTLLGVIYSRNTAPRARPAMMNSETSTPGDEKPCRSDITAITQWMRTVLLEGFHLPCSTYPQWYNVHPQPRFNTIPKQRSHSKAAKRHKTSLACMEHVSGQA